MLCGLIQVSYFFKDDQIVSNELLSLLLINIEHVCTISNRMSDKQNNLWVPTKICPINQASLLINYVNNKNVYLEYKRFYKYVDDT